MNIEQLKYVMAIVKHQHLTNASYEVSISQSSLSKYLIKLEKELGGVQLFDRTTRTVKLTAAGQEFAKYANRILDEYDHMLNEMRTFTNGERGVLSVGTIPVYSSRGLISLFASFQKKYPEIQLDITEKMSSELIGLLKKAELDMAFIALPENFEKLEAFSAYPMIKDEVVLITQRGHPYANREAISLSEVKYEPFILMNQASTLFQICMDACKKAGFTPDITHESSQIDIIVGLVAEGLGVSLITSKEAEYFSTANISLIRLEKSINHTTALVVNNRMKRSNAMKAFLNHAQDWEGRTSEAAPLNSDREGNIS
ncbi:LysR family transcriptional regulator [Neobacillus drentensis]|uniref:LysR family transcriptional regulator n=1 Tax=Neobacillus drentensis TaxID=220684 RepID=UPI001F28EE78|nr:LysR family transcriptional regulator [Neobacillus drentensis]ULT58840.1 LysR family transcriptional regulator [Neobacillus drentensis]